ncbi:TRAP transporter substrate-binding protein [Pseudorhodoplanes sp.]|uniref:TRAP transporter substrate-binding protein n=1 Tax=Pseudorhodoplanes sp. TaxID=1934341 RepID=UPI003D10B14A
MQPFQLLETALGASAVSFERRVRNRITLPLVLLAGLSFAASNARAAPIELRFGAGYAQGELLSKPIEKFADLIKEKSKGEISPRVFYQSLGTEQQLTQSVMSGTVDIGELANGNASRFTNAFLVYDLPFLFKKYDNLISSLDSEPGRKVIAQFEKDLGVKYLFAISNAVGRDVQTRAKSLKTPADIKGLKIRVVSSPIDLATFKAWGANPAPVDTSQVYSATQQGVVDGVQFPLTFLLTSKLYEVVKYSISIEYQAATELVFMNAKKFTSLSPAHQAVLLDAAKETQAWGIIAARELAEKAVKEMAAHGLVIHKPTPEEYNQWAAVREKVWEEVAKQQSGKIDLELARAIYAQQP